LSFIPSFLSSHSLFLFLFLFLVKKVIVDFKEGGYNVLVATCIGEEGLDIGEVDLIVCFDAQNSPVRMIQRMGRTGRKRAGR
jgi:Fanconi anemia group M protein